MTPRECYQADLQRHGFREDRAQLLTVDCFQDLYQRLLEAPPDIPLWKRLFVRPPEPVRGLYLWGGPGRGKTYLMDCFYRSLPFENKRRVHFHRFMLEIHRELDRLPRTPDPLLVVADMLAKRCRVLCLDEFHVTDIADAMLLSGLFKALFARRVTLVATSNIEPDKLYKDGLQRELFLPAIELLLQHTQVHRLDSKQDFRLALLQHGGTYQIADKAMAFPWLDRHMGELSPVEPQYNTSIKLHGREFHVTALADDVIWFEFEELCVKPRSAYDYLELAREFHTLLLAGVPRFGEESDEAARRFMHLVDALYDHGVKLVMAADAAPKQLYEGERLNQAFQRTASRLTEMSSAAYLARAHSPD